MLDSNRASEVLGRMETDEYARVEHVSMALLWRTRIRTGSVSALAVADNDPDTRMMKGRYRPESGTLIENQGEGEESPPALEVVRRLTDIHRVLARRMSPTSLGYSRGEVGIFQQSADVASGERVSELVPDELASERRRPVLLVEPDDVRRIVDCRPELIEFRLG